MRAKIIVPNLIAILVLGLGAYFYLNHDLRAKGSERLRSHLSAMQVLFQRSESLRGYELLGKVRSDSTSRSIVDAFVPVAAPIESNIEDAKMTDQLIRQAWFKRCADAIETYSAEWIDKTGKRPELAFLTDRKGVVIARNITPNACPAGYNVAAAIPTIARALEGKASYGIWSVDGSPFGKKKNPTEYCSLINSGLLELAAAPVWYGDNIAGVLVVGFDLSNGEAQKKAQMLNLDVAVLQDGVVYSSSLGTDKARQNLQEQLGRQDISALLTAVTTTQQPSKIIQFDIDNRPYFGIIVPTNSPDDQGRAATLLMGSVDSATADTKSLVVILALMGIMLLGVFIFGMALTQHFLRPIMAIEEGVLKVINGEYSYRMDVRSAEVGGLGYRINQLIGVLTGEEEDTSEE